MAAGVLYIVATPIGNLRDITHRAVDVLGSVDFVICEDSRKSGLLLKHYGIKKPFRVLHEHSSGARIRQVLDELEAGRQAALVTDAGTPLISDPGFRLVVEALRAGVRVESIPGPTAFVNALVTSGLPVHEFSFFGYLPQKAGARRKRLEALRAEPRTLIFYESPHRILKTLRDMLEVLGDRPAAVAREMTKKFEESVRGNLKEILLHFEGKEVLGEFTIVVSGAKS